MKTDMQIQTDVMQELRWDPSVTHEHIGVSVMDGVVTLSGTVPTYIEKSAAENAAQKVEGVKAIVEKIDVKLPGSHKRDDQDLAKAIIEQFKWDVQVPDQLIKAGVEDGWVELNGEVDWEYQRSAAANCVRGLTGVKGVVNNIKLKAKKIQPEVVKQKIEEALKRRAEQEARRIGVEISGNKVILTGKVDTLAEIQDVKWAAWSAPGVSNIESQLRLK